VSWTCVWRAPGRGAAAISALAWTHLGSRRGRLLSAGLFAPLPPAARGTRDDVVVVPLASLLLLSCVRRRFTTRIPLEGPAAVASTLTAVV
jgi:hypothetical protein